MRSMAQTSAEWFRGVTDLKQRHKERLMENIKATLEADREFDRERAEWAAALEEKVAEAREEFENRTFDTEEMVARCKARPLMVEEAFIPRVWSKKTPHRRPLLKPRKQLIRSN